MAGVTGLEPATSGVTGQRSNQLSYTPPPQSGRCPSRKSALGQQVRLLLLLIWGRTVNGKMAGRRTFFRSVPQAR